MAASVKASQVGHSSQKSISKLSLASLVALGAGMLLIALTIVVVYVDTMFIARTTGRASLSVAVLFFSSFALPAIGVLGIGLGIAGLLRGGRRKALAWLSVAGNVVYFLLVCAVVALALLLEGYGSTP